MNFFGHLLFIVQQRRAGNRVSFSAYIKGHEKIELGRGCKIHADASVDASRSPGVKFAAGPLAALWQEARQGKGNVRLMYTFVVLLAWLEKHPLDGYSL